MEFMRDRHVYSFSIKLFIYKLKISKQNEIKNQ
jgi:hypothetical protein